jgi:DNA mismatch endonuclease, patch repair protein
MASIRSRNTKPEIILRKALFKRGYRYRIHVKNLPGRPDIVLPRYGTVVFVNGCFWHMHDACRTNMIPKANVEYWIPKLKRNVERDALNQKELKKAGWKIVVIWECEIRNHFQKVVDDLISQLNS